MADIVVIGSMNMDLSVMVPRIPAPGETISGGGLVTSAGGKGANQAAACAKLGGSVSMVGCVGQDDFGKRMTAGLASLGVDVSQVRADNETPSGTAMIMVDALGENCIVISPGANAKVQIADNAAVTELIRRAKILLLQLEIPLHVVISAVETAARWGVPVLLNPAPAVALPQEIFSKIDYLVPNETEAAILSGIPVNDMDSAKKAAQKLVEKGVKTVIITLGDQGAYVASSVFSGHIPAIPVNVVDTTAAGDSFIGGFACAQVNRYSLEDSIRFACCTGALAATKFGAQASLPTLAEVMAIFARTEEPL